MSQEILSFPTVEAFVEALNAYKGENLWQDLVWGTEIAEDPINEGLTATKGNSSVIYLTSGAQVIYGLGAHYWRLWLPPSYQQPQWRPDVDPHKPMIFLPQLTPAQVYCLHTIINNVFLNEEGDFDEDVANELLSMINDVYDERIVPKQIFPPCAGTIQRSQETN